MTINDYARLYEAVMSRESKSQPKYEKSFRYLQDMAILTRRAFQMITTQYEKDRDEVLKEYSTSPAGAKMLAELQSKYNEARKQAEAELKKTLDEVVQSKRDAIQKSCKAPSTEDVNLLSVLNMRSRLTENDIVHAAEAVGDNLTSLGTLKDIAERHQIHLQIPTAEGFEKQLDIAANYARSRLSEAFTPEKELTYYGTEFYLYSNEKDSVANSMFEEIDSSVFTSEQKGETKINLKTVKEAILDKQKQREQEKEPKKEEQSEHGED